MLIGEKIFVITDERCGGTQMASLFSKLGYKIIDDPQTYTIHRNEKINNKNFVLNNLNFFYKYYDYVKICLISYTIKEYVSLINQAVRLGCKIILLWRRNYLERVLSKVIATETGVWHNYHKNNNTKYNNYFKLNILNIKEHLNSHKNKLYFIMNYLRVNSIKHYPLMYENIYNPSLHDEQRAKQFYKIFNYINPSLINYITQEQHNYIIKQLSPRMKINNKKTYSRIINIRQIIKQFSNNENGIITLN